MRRNLLTLLALLLAASAPAVRAEIADKVTRAKAGGIDLIACKTEVRDVVTFRGSLPAGDSFAPKENVAIATLTGEMLDKGTTQHDKFAIAQKLDDIGARIDFNVGGVMVEFRGKCLRKDLPVVMALLAEELRAPAFSAEEFTKLKKQLAGEFQRALESTDYRASQAFAEAVFPVGHPNYSPPTKEFIAAIESAKLEQVKAFHAAFYGPAHATLVVVGDFDLDGLKKDLATAFNGWIGGKPIADFPDVALPEKRKEETIEMADKPNVTVIIGQTSGMKYKDEGALALRAGTAALGSGFTGRLMANVRDKEGLTYGIGAGLADDAFTDGAWEIQANFAPELLEKGMAATQRELDSWYEKGITEPELERVKSNLIGTFKVSLATTDGLSNALLNAIHRGYDVTWLDEYPKRIAALTLADVNGSIKKHLAPAKMTVIKAGSIVPVAKPK